MGVNLTAVTFFGVALHERRVQIEVKTKAFAHNYPEDFQFDPKSGKALWNISCRIRPELENEPGLHVFTPWNSKIMYIGYYMTAANESTREFATEYDPVHISDQKDALKKLLYPLGLWDNDNVFKIWTLCEYSV